MGDKPRGAFSPSANHISMLHQVLGSFLNNGIEHGVSIKTFEINNFYPLIYGGDVPNSLQGFNSSTSRYFFNNSLELKLVKGKMVVCDTLTSGQGVFYAGAAGTVMQDSGEKDYALSFPLPATYLDPDSGTAIFNYINSTSKALATILKSYQANDSSVPYVASFSSRVHEHRSLFFFQKNLTI
ncbi:hypothetical protein RJ641_012152 [Dillenia turbinata]|uniref:Uncharacterized protein n=1 Tax=Dillenia turbinata TaxID=194707 RepID=A0AAN8Z3M1_9MAGN